MSFLQSPSTPEAQPDREIHASLFPGRAEARSQVGKSWGFLLGSPERSGAAGHRCARWRGGRARGSSMGRVTSEGRTAFSLGVQGERASEPGGSSGGGGEPGGFHSARASGKNTPRKLWRNNWAAGLAGLEKAGGREGRRGGGGGKPGRTGAGQSRAPEGRGPSGPAANGVRESAAPGAQSLLGRGAGRGQDALGGLQAPAGGTAVRTAAPPSGKVGAEVWR